MTYLTTGQVQDLMVEECKNLGCTCDVQITVDSYDSGRVMHANAAHDPACPVNQPLATVTVRESVSHG